MRSVLLDRQPEVVAIPGWSKWRLRRAPMCAATGTPAIMMSETTAGDEPRVAWRETIKRRIVRLYATALVGGQRHADYLVALGLPRDRIFTGYDAVDNAFFAQGAMEAKCQRSEVRGRYGLPENYFVASARFIAKKNLATLLRAYAAYHKHSSLVTSHSLLWHLVLLGAGPLRKSLNSQLSTCTTTCNCPALNSTMSYRFTTGWRVRSSTPARRSNGVCW